LRSGLSSPAAGVMDIGMIRRMYLALSLVAAVTGTVSVAETTTESCIAELASLNENQPWSEKTENGWDDYILPIAYFRLQGSELCNDREVAIVFKSDEQATLRELRKGGHQQYQIAFPVGFFVSESASIESSQVWFEIYP
ncbi:MAG: hypothetical protein KBT53_04160, partial [Porticoccus sp.]|nr:hypothetical protein [Porticoccus sp.]